MKKKKGIQSWHIVLISLLPIFLLIAWGNSGSDNKEQKQEVKQEAEEIDGNYKIKYGELLDTKVNGSTLIIKTKIEPNLTNEMTINQNYYNVEKLIREQGCDTFDEIQYWAVADMTSGNEEKVIAFTLDKNTIDGINNQTILPPNMGDYVDDLYIHVSLRE